MPESLGVLEAISTTRAIRRFQTDPIPEGILRSLLQAATCAPNGGNAQSWRFIVIRHEAEIKEILSIPPEIDTYALVPLGYPRDPFGPLRRGSLEDVVSYDGWD